MARWQAVFFDLDGTMYDWRSCWEQATQQTIAEYVGQFPASDDQDLAAAVATFSHYGRVLFAEVDRGCLDIHTARRLRYMLTAAAHGWDMSDRAVQSFLERHVALIEATTKPWPDLGPTLRTLQEQHRLPLGVITNGPPDEQRRKLSILAVEAYFEPAAVIVSGEHGYAKPDPRIFRAALTALCVSPAQALYVGDSWENDVLGGLRAGLDVAWFNPDGAARPTELPPSRGTLYEVARLEDLLALDGLVAAT